MNDDEIKGPDYWVKRLREAPTEIVLGELVNEVERLRVAASILAKLVTDEFIEVDLGTAYIYKGEYTAFDEAECAYLVRLTAGEGQPC